MRCEFDAAIGRLAVFCLCAFSAPVSADRLYGELPCDDPTYLPRDGSWPKATPWKIAGAYDAFVMAAGQGMATADIDNDGRPEILIPGVDGTVWQAVGFNPLTGNYEIEYSARPEFPFILNQSTHAARITIGSLTPGGPLKIFTNAESTMYDFATRRLELVSFLDPQLTRIRPMDLDGDGVRELVANEGVVVDAEFSRYLSYGGIGAMDYGQLDADANVEGIGPDGVYEWRNGVWAREFDLPYGNDRLYIQKLADFDGDGVLEVATSTGGSTVAVGDASGSRVSWSVTVTNDGSGVHQIGDIGVADVNADGVVDVLVSTGGLPNVDPGDIRAYDGRNGALLWSFTYPDQMAGGFLVGNFDDEPGLELVFGSDRAVIGPWRTNVYDLATRTLEWRQQQELFPVSALAVADVLPEPGNEVLAAPAAVVGEADSPIHIRGIAGMESLATLDSAMLPEPAFEGVYALAVGDVAGAVGSELVVGTDDFAQRGSVYVYSWPNRSLVASFKLARGTLVNQLATADLDGDGDDEIVAVVQVRDSNFSDGVRVYALDARTGTVSWELGPLFAITHGVAAALKVADITGDGRPEIILSGENIAVIDGATRAVSKSATGNYYGLDIADADGDGVQDLVAGFGADDGGAGFGELHILSLPALEVTDRFQVCNGVIHAVAWNRWETTRRQAFVTCDSEVRVADVATHQWQVASVPVGNEIGLQNHLLLATTPAGEHRLIVGGRWGAFSLAPTTNLPPYLAPLNVCQPHRFVKQWRKTMQAGQHFYDHDGDTVTTRIVRVPVDVTATTTVTDGLSRIAYDTPARRGIDLFSTQAEDGTDSSPRAVASLYIDNDVPTVIDFSFSVAPGNTYGGSFGGNDFDNDPLSYEITQPPSKGTVQIDGSQFTYVASVDSSGHDEFRVQAFDQVDYSAEATVSVDIVADSPPPPPPPPPPTPTSSGGGGATGPLGLLLLAAMRACQGRRRGRTRHASNDGAARHGRSVVP